MAAALAVTEQEPTPTSVNAPAGVTVQNALVVDENVTGRLALELAESGIWLKVKPTGLVGAKVTVCAAGLTVKVCVT